MVTKGTLGLIKLKLKETKLVYNHRFFLRFVSATHFDLWKFLVGGWVVGSCVKARFGQVGD